MITQKATVTQIEKDRVWLKAERQTSCQQCQLKRSCGSGLLSDHVGTRFTKIAIDKKSALNIGQQVTIAFPEEALIKGTALMYLVPLLMLIFFSVIARSLSAHELIEILSGFLGLVGGFFFVRCRLKKRRYNYHTTIVED